MIIGEAEIAVLANTKAFDESLRSGVRTGAEGAATDAEAALSGGLKKTEQDAAKEGENIGGKLSGGISSGLSKLGNIAGAVGLPLGSLGMAADKAGNEMKKADTGSKGLMGTLSTLGGATLLGATAGFVAFGAAGVKAALDQQTANAQLAASAGITVKAATNIGNAFLNTMGTTVFSGTQITQAYAGVAAQLGSTEGHALSAGQAMTVMKASMDLAEATGGSLTSTTSDLGKAMQAFQLPTKDAASAASALFQAGRMSGAGLDGVTNVMLRMRATMGVTSPSIQQMGALLVDMADHGETGRKAMSALNSATTTLLKPTTALAAAQMDQKNAAAGLPQSLQAIAASYAAGTATAKDVSGATKGLTNDQATLWKEFVKSTDAVNKAKDSISNMGIQVTNAHGSFVGFSAVIDQLKPKLEGETQAQQLATLQSVFGAQANKTLLETVLAGGAAFDKATASVSQSNAAHKAAEEQSQTLKRQFDVMKATIDDLAVKFGAVLIPKIEDLLHWVSESVQWLEQHKTVALALAAAIGSVLAVAVGAFAVNTMAKFIDSIKTAISHVIGLTSNLPGMGGAAEEAGAGVESAATSAETMQGTLTSLTTAIEELTATLQGGTTPAAQELATALTEDGAAAGEAAGQLQLFATASEEAGAAAGTAGGEIGAAGLAGEAKGAEGALAGAGEGAGLAAGGLSAMLGPVGLVVGGMGLLAFGASKLNGLLGGGLNQAGQQAASGIEKLLQNLPTANIYQMSGSFDSLRGKIAAMAGPNASFQQGLAATKAIASQPMFGKLSTDAQDLLSSYNKLSGAIPQYKTNMAILSAQFGTSTQNVQQLAQMVGINLTQALRPDQIKLFSQALQQSGTQTLDTQGKIQQLGTTSTATAIAISSGFKEKMPDIPNAAKSAADQLKGVFTALDLGPKGQEKVEQIATAIHNDPNAVNAMKTLAQNVHDTAAQKDLSDAGVSMGQGIAKGITQSEAQAVSAIVDLVNKTVTAGKGAAKATSPSRLTADEIGEPLTQGVAMGMTRPSALGTVRGAARQVQDHIMASFGGTGTGTPGGVGIGAGGGPVVQVTIAQGAIVINAPAGTTPSQLGPLAASVNEGLTVLAQEIAAGVAPMRSTASR